LIEEGLDFYYIDQRREVQGHFAETRQATSLSLHLYTSILDLPVLLIKSINDFCGVCHESDDFENPFSKITSILLRHPI